MDRSNGAEPAWSQRRSMAMLARRNREMKDLTAEDAQAVTRLVELPGFEFAVWDGNPGYMRASNERGSVPKHALLTYCESVRRHVILCLGGSPYELDGVTHCTELDGVNGSVPNGAIKIMVKAREEER